MASRSRIEWTETTWNPVTGCSKVSPGCRRCYAEPMSRRLRAMSSPKYRNGFALTLHPHRPTRGAADAGPPAGEARHQPSERRADTKELGERHPPRAQ